MVFKCLGGVFPPGEQSFVRQFTLHAISEQSEPLNHRMAWVERDLKLILGRDIFHYPKLLQPKSSLALDISKIPAQRFVSNLQRFTENKVVVS